MISIILFMSPQVKRTIDWGSLKSDQINLKKYVYKSQYIFASISILSIFDLDLPGVIKTLFIAMSPLVFGYIFVPLDRLSLPVAQNCLLY